MSHILIVGAGASGLFCAAQALERGHKVTLVEHMAAEGKKLLITGKGRCNLTNDCDEDEFLKNIRNNPRFLFSAIHQFPPQKTMEWFEQKQGVPLKTERGRRVFPQSDEAADILAALQRATHQAARVRGQVTRLLIRQDVLAGVVLQDGREILADKAVIATGGLSYPVTGSTGLGYQLARQAGHTVVTPVPSLVSLVEKGGTCKKLMGLSLRNVNVTLLQNGKAVFSEQGEMLFTHFGLSGPVILSASAYIKDLSKYTYTVSIDMKPALSEEKLDKRLQRDFEELGAKNVSNSLDKLLPGKMRQVMLERWGVDPEGKVNQITRPQRLQLAKLVKNFTVEIGDRGDLQHAVITAGGVCVKEIDPKTMESKKLPGLYCIGEVLDVDGYTGGYNLQIAFATAYAAARSFETKEENL